MDYDGPALEHLPRDECIRLMASVPIGRIVYTSQALPAVELVNFALHGGDIVIRTDPEGKLAAATRGTVVAFEADSVDVAGQAGWSVTIVGQAWAVIDNEEIRDLEQIALHPVGTRKAGSLHPDFTGHRPRTTARRRAEEGRQRCASYLNSSWRWRLARWRALPGPWSAATSPPRGGRWRCSTARSRDTSCSR
jgi:hypothetical protein